MKPPIKYLDLRYYPDGDVSQFFGENKALYAQFDMAGHNGIDLVRPWGEPIYAVEAGVVVKVKDNPHGYGKHIKIASNNLEWAYGHHAQNLVKVNDKVFAGQMIATMGNTGFTVSGNTPYWNSNPYAGTHLHIGVREISQGSGWSYEGSDILMKVRNHSNGYKGSIDPLPLLRQVQAPLPNRNMWKQLLTIQSILNNIKKLLG